MEDIMGRIPPSSIEAEQSVIGSLITDSETVPIVTEILSLS